MEPLTLAQALRVIERPAYVTKTAAAPGAYSFDDREATFISYLQAELDNADAQIKQACVDHAKLWGITEDCEKSVAQLKTASAPRELQASDYALVFEYNGKTLAKYAAYDPSSVVESAVSFHDNRHRYPFHLRKQAASSLLARAERMDVHLPAYVDTYLHKAAGLGVATSDNIENAMITRDDACPREHRDAFEKVAQVLDLMYETPALRYDFGFVKSAIAALDRFDTLAGIADRVPLPEEIIDDNSTVPVLQKAAAYSRRIVRLVNGAEIDTSQLTKEALSAVDANLNGLNEAELTEVLPTLPKSDADLLVRLVG